MTQQLSKWKCPECHEELDASNESVEVYCRQGHVCLLGESNPTGKRHAIYRGYQVRSWRAVMNKERH